MVLDASHESAARIKSLLEASGVEMVEWATSGTGWLAAFQTANPAFLFVDLQLPKRDGLYCLEKARGLSPMVRGVFMHSYQGAYANEIELRAFALGAVAVAQKPLQEARFTTMLDRLVGLWTVERNTLRKSSTVNPTQKR